MQHLDEIRANIHLANEMKHLEHTLETYMYSHFNMCNVPIYFCNIKMKHLQHIDETSETLETYSCNMGFAWTNGGTSVRMSTRRMDFAVRQQHGQLASGRGVTRISSPSPSCWSIRRGGSLAR